jgi:hypothetical protein
VSWVVWKINRIGPHHPDVSTVTLHALALVLLLSFGFASCGNGAPVRAVSHAVKMDADQDSDGDGPVGDDDLYFGHSADASSRRSIGIVLRHYYAVAAEGSGARACNMIDSRLKREIPIVYGRPPGPPELKGGTCAIVMSKLFELHHRQLVDDASTLMLGQLLVEGDRALAFLRFKGASKRFLYLKQERGMWMIEGLLDWGPPQKGN